MIDESENLLTFTLPENEFETLDKHHVFDILNQKYGLLIDIYESETVIAEQLKNEYRAISLQKGAWLEAVAVADK